MLRLLINGYTLDQKILLRDCLASAYVEATQTKYICNNGSSVTRDISNALAWLEEDISKTFEEYAKSKEYTSSVYGMVTVKE